MIFAQMAGLLAMPTLLPEGVLSAEGEDAQAVNSSWETTSSPSIEPGGVGAAWLAAEKSRVLTNLAVTEGGSGSSNAFSRVRGGGYLA